MSDDNKNFWKSIAGILGPIIVGVIVYYLTEGAFWNKNDPIPITPPSPTQTTTPTPIPITPPNSTPNSPPTPSSSPVTSDVGVAIVFDPPSNVRDSPNGKILCSVQRRTTINIYDSTNSWYRTDICGEMGVIHESQITFSSNSTIIKSEKVIPTTPPNTKPSISPEQEVNSYFNDINNGLYQAAWDRLPTTLQKNENLHPEGFKSFEKWYEKMNSVDVIEVNVAENYPNSAEVNIRIVYNFKDGKTGSNSLRFLLSWDSQEEKWRITEFKKN